MKKSNWVVDPITGRAIYCGQEEELPTNNASLLKLSLVVVVCIVYTIASMMLEMNY